MRGQLGSHLVDECTTAISVAAQRCPNCTAAVVPESA
jgi:hypothetical protein